jgi:zinc transport system ATP-binding protein
MPVTTPPALELTSLHFAYQGQEVLHDINAIVPQGAYVGIVGPNGGGKTTLLKLILGLNEPSHGSVLLLGKHPEKARREGRIGYVPQRIVQADFSFPASVEEIVRSGRAHAAGMGRMLSKKDTAAVEEAMETAGITHLRHRLLGTLSGGERQKAFIARAVAAHPDVLMLDEPTTGVDSGSQDEFYILLRTLHKNGMTIFFVSHDIEVMAKEASTILCLNRTLIAHSDGCDFMHSPEAKALYGSHVHHIHHHHA